MGCDVNEDEAEPVICDRCDEEIEGRPILGLDQPDTFHVDCAPPWMTNYVAAPVPIEDESTTPTLCVAYPVEGGVHLVNRYRDRAGGHTEVNVLVSLDDGQVDDLMEELEKWRDESPEYTPPEER